MKNKKISFETKFWNGNEISNPFDAVNAFIAYGHIDYYKQVLSDVVLSTQKEEIYNKGHLDDVFIFYTLMRSFLKSSRRLPYDSDKWKYREAVTDCGSVLHQSSLSTAEYNDPFMVFRNAFNTLSLADFECFLCEIISLALSPYLAGYEIDLITPYIHLIKMLDAAQVLKERGVEKIKKREAENAWLDGTEALG